MYYIEKMIYLHREKIENFMSKIYLRFNLAKHTHLVQIQEQTKCYNIKDKLHIDKTLEEYYIGCDVYA